MEIKAEIKLDEQFKAVFEGDNIVLYKHRTIINKKEKTERHDWAWEGYYTSIRGLLKGYLKASVLQTGAATLQEIAEDIDRIEKNIDRVLEKVKGGDYN